MKHSQSTKLFAYIGLIMILVSLVIGIWIALENRSMIRKDDDSSVFQDADERTAFFYSRIRYTPDDSNYSMNPAPGVSGSTFFLLMLGITFVLFAFHESISSVKNQIKYLARIGRLIAIISLVIAVCVSYSDYWITKERYDEDSDFENMQDTYSLTIIMRYVNSVFIFLGPALILYSLYKERESSPDDIYDKICFAGIVLLVIAVILALFCGITTKMIFDEQIKDQPDGERIADLFAFKAFISHLFPYLPYFSLGLILFPFLENEVKDVSTITIPSTLIFIGFICVIVGLIIFIYPAVQYHQMADEYKLVVKGEKNQYFQSTVDYAESTAYCYYGTSIVFLGFGLMLFSIIIQRFFKAGKLSDMLLLNIGIFILLMLGIILGFYAGHLRKEMKPGDEVGFYTVQYFYMILLFSSIGSILYSWTQDEEVFKVRYFCPECNEELEYIDDYGSVKEIWYCEDCEEHKLINVATSKFRRPPHCRKCSDSMSYVPKYNRWYCYNCERYGKASKRKNGPARKEKDLKPIPKRTTHYPWKEFKCKGCGKTAEIKTNKRPLNIKCSRCGRKDVL